MKDELDIEIENAILEDAKLDKEINDAIELDLKKNSLKQQQKEASTEANILPNAALGVGKYFESGAPSEIGGALNMALQVPQPIRQVLPFGGASVLFEDKLKGIARAMQENSQTSAQEYEGLSEGMGKSGVGKFSMGLGESVTGMIPQLIGSRLGGMPASLAVTGLQTAGSTYTDAIEKYKQQGLTQDEAEKRAILPSLANAVASVAITKAMGKTGLDVEKFKGGFVDAAKQFGLEGAEELLQSVAQSAISKLSYNPKLTAKDAALDAVLSGLGGGIITLGPSAVRGFMNKFGGKSDKETPPPIPQSPPPIPTEAKVPETPEEAKIQSTVLPETKPDSSKELTGQKAEEISNKSISLSKEEQQYRDNLEEKIINELRNKDFINGSSIVKLFDEYKRLTGEKFDFEKGGVINEEAQRQEVLTEPGAAEPQSAAPVEPPPIPTTPPPLPQQPPPIPQVGIKNAFTEQERINLGLAQADEILTKSFGENKNEAIDILSQNRDAGEGLIAHQKAHPKMAFTDTEYALLLIETAKRKSELTQAYKEIGKATDPLAKAVEEKRFNEALNRYKEALDVAASTGTASGRALNARKMMIDEDFSLESMLTKEMVEVNKGEQLKPEQVAKVTEEHNAIKQKQDEVAALELKNDEFQAGKAFDDTVGQLERDVKRENSYSEYVMKVAEQIVGNLEGRANEARKRINQRLGRTNVGVDPTLLTDLAQVGAYHISKLGLDFAKWSVAMKGEFGDWVAEHLPSVYESSQKVVDSIAKRMGNRSKNAVKNAVTKQSETIESIRTKAEQKVAGGNPDISNYARKLARKFIEQGVKGRDNVLDAVYNELKTIVPDKRSVADAISGYGKYKQLSKDQIDIELRDLVGQLQQISKIEDMKAGKAPSKTGSERRTPSDEERRLIKQVEELKKKGGYIVTDPASQLRTALQAIKTRLTNDIKDLEWQIANKQKIVKEKRDVQLDQEAIDLTAKRDALREEYDQIFGRKELTDQQRINMAMKSVQRSIAEYERRIAEKDFTTTKKVSKTPETPELKAERAKRDALKEEYNTLKDIETPKKSPEEIYLQAYKTRIANNIAELQRRIAEGDFEPKKKKTFADNPEIIKAKFEYQKVKDKYIERKFEDSLKREDAIKRGFRRALQGWQIVRSILTGYDLSAVLRQGGIIATTHPLRAIKATVPMLEALRSEERAFKIDEAIKKRENYENGKYNAAGLFLSEHGTMLSKMEEATMNLYSKKVPWLMNFQRAYTTFLNQLRVESFDAMEKTLTKSGEKATLEEAKAIANYVNIVTGRGDLGRFQVAAPVLSEVFFAPRFVASRLQYPLILGHYTKGTGGFIGKKSVKRLIAFEQARYFIGQAVMLGLASAMGGVIETDSKSSDFLKIKIGNTRIDLFSGLLQAMVLASRLIKGETKKGGGRIVDNRGPNKPFGEPGTWGLMGRFLQSKLSPQMSIAGNLIAGEDYVGRPYSLKDTWKTIVPMTYQDVVPLFKEYGLPGGLGLTMLSILGAGVQNFDENKNERPAGDIKF